jgi:hypothetical protein
MRRHPMHTHTHTHTQTHTNTHTHSYACTNACTLSHFRYERTHVQTHTCTSTLALSSLSAPQQPPPPQSPTPPRSTPNPAPKLADDTTHSGLILAHSIPVIPVSQAAGRPRKQRRERASRASVILARKCGRLGSAPISRTRCSDLLWTVSRCGPEPD